MGKNNIVITEQESHHLQPVELYAGDMLRVPRYLGGEHVYDHYGIYVGDGKVIHFARKSGLLFGQDPAIVHETTLERFLDGSREVYVVETSGNHTKTPEEVVNTAYESIGESGYHVVFNNCEHFARYCKTGHRISGQVVQIGAKLAGELIALAMMGGDYKIGGRSVVL